MRHRDRGNVCRRLCFGCDAAASISNATHPYTCVRSLCAMMSGITELRSSAIERINRRTYGSRGALRQFAAASGWLEAGERLAIEHVAASVPRGAILDIRLSGRPPAPL